MIKSFHCYCDGFERTVSTTDEIKAFAAWLRANGCVGKTLKVWQGTQHGQASVYEPNCPHREFVL